MPSPRPSSALVRRTRTYAEVASDSGRGFDELTRALPSYRSVLAEYANLLTAAILATTFFLGGYSGPSFLPGFVWFSLKALLMVFLIMWFRWTFPRTRVDQILTFGWKALVPLSIANVFLTGIGMYLFGLV